ncbi:AMP-binding protein [Ornithinimicrobium cryptoxanthini]|uniref:AMP-binding protein n=1 Tax=Ornithinimicrobium cryptoxanthini TaxID=2934161 RepID=UPI002118399C|nr:AMP-binding protein [Ornithinimicrobium cryptoxanthini]
MTTQVRSLPPVLGRSGLRSLTQPTLAEPTLLDTADLADPRAPALVGPDGATLTHGELREHVADLARQLPDPAEGRALVHLPMRNDLASVTAYLAVLESGHCALVTSDDPDRTAPILTAYPPDVTATGDPTAPFAVRSGGPAHLLHPDVVLLLSTSGSTGSPKLVRLSRGNVRSNARAIAAALALRPTDRGITSLPLHYCFGLSVLHSHLVSGGSVAVTDHSVLDRGFWECVDEQQVTTLAVVPHSVELLAGTGELARPHPSLRLVAQAGGRMPKGRVREIAALGRRQGFDLAVMYGQTEATARICVLDPALTQAHPDAVGHPVPGTTLHLDATVPDAVDGAGEVVVRGPGVMMGYAEHRDDLALGAMLTELRTGDLGRVDEAGILRIVGRRSGFIKVLGLRIDLAVVESALEAEGLDVCVTGDDSGLRVAVAPTAETTPTGEEGSRLAARARRIAAETSGVGVAAVTALAVPLARLENGKVDRAGCDALVRAGVPDECEDTRRGVAVAFGASPTLEVRVAGVLGEVLARDEIDLGASFVELGGDSLTHVQASIRLEEVLGPLPTGWHRRPLRQLVEAGRRGASDGAPVTRRTVETSVLLRAVAVVMICGSHADLFRLLGGAHTLLAVAGFNAARFGLSAPRIPTRWRGTLRMLIGVAVPTMVVALFGMVTHDRYGWGNVLMANWVAGDVTYGKHNELWFIDALVASLIVLTLLLSVPPLARAWRETPWRVAILIAVLGLVPRFAILSFGDGVLRGIMPTTFWLFAIGAAVAHADTRRRRLVTLGLAVVGGITFFPDDPVRNLTILAGIAVLTLVPEVRLPARWVGPISVLAAASLYIYLIQFQILGWVPTALGATLAALAAGCLLWWLAARPMRRLQDLVPVAPSVRPRRK